MRFGGLIFGRAYLFILFGGGGGKGGLLSEFYGIHVLTLLDKIRTCFEILA